MSESILFRLYRSELQAKMDVLEAWQGKHQDAMIAQDMEDIVSACLDDPARLRRLIDSNLKKVQSGQLDDLNEARSNLLNLVQIQLTLLEQARVLVQIVEKGGHRIAGATKLEQAIDAVEKQKDGLFRHWPEVRPSEAAEARAAADRGECSELGDAFARMAGVDIETWQKRVEAHERAKQP
jgi:hypothetical protein